MPDKPNGHEMIVGSRKLEIGAGEHPQPGGFIHNDIEEFPHIELVGDARRLAVASSSVYIIKAIHVLEHFTYVGAQEAIDEWRRVLVPDGLLEVAMPNVDALIGMWKDGDMTYEAMMRDLWGIIPDHFPLPSPEEFENRLRNSPFFTFLHWLYTSPAEWKGHNVHRWGYNPAGLQRLLQESGFTRIAIKIEQTSLHGWAAKEGD